MEKECVDILSVSQRQESSGPPIQIARKEKRLTKEMKIKTRARARVCVLFTHNNTYHGGVAIVSCFSFSGRSRRGSPSMSSDFLRRWYSSSPRVSGGREVGIKREESERQPHTHITARKGSCSDENYLRRTVQPFLTLGNSHRTTKAP